jgi:putative restriction endonuclease
MPRTTMTCAFADYGAAPVNPRWAVSAISNNGELVVSCWDHYLREEKGVRIYEDSFGRWGTNRRGRELLFRHLTAARKESLPVRLVIATTTRPDIPNRGQDGSLAPKTFSTRPELIGRVAWLDEYGFRIEFREIPHDPDGRTKG